MKASFSLDFAGTTSVVYPIRNHQNGAVSVQISAISAGNVVVEATVDDTNWVTLPTKNVNTEVANTTIAAAGIYYFEIVGYSSFRVRKSDAGTASGACRFNLG